MDDKIAHAIDQIGFQGGVPDDVVQRFDDVESVLDSSRGNKRLIRVALEYSLASFELALRIFCDRFGLLRAMDQDASHTFQNFIEWVHANDYLPRYAIEEAEDRPPYSRAPDETIGPPEFYWALKRLRNRWIHPVDSSWLGSLVLQLIPSEVDLINRLYKRPEIRPREREKRRDVNRRHCKRLSKPGAALDTPDRRVLVHEVNMLHYDMRESPHTYYFAFWPLFDTDPQPGDRLDDRKPHLARCLRWTKTKSGSLSLTTNSGRILTVDRKLSSGEKKKLGKWSEEAGLSRHAAFDVYGPANLRAALLDLKQGFPLNLQELPWID